MSLGYGGKDFRCALTYSTRINRPTYNQLIVKNVYIDPLSYSTGYPLLRSTLTDNLSLSFQKGKFVGRLSYLHINNQ
ncbi:outer membrane beta-barrel protein, partial [Salmonella enterica]|uniref:outer membrane beta-barrel protein n=1 Tax=Salmonella enterica TaxID=28901 RepID=UPI003CED11AB